ncbi:dynein regulatory complex protein 9 isoform X2 [Gouania willdenowi]|uniref:dynein regulatory complex protein 9 isoform X2 n=1 Tax=Gouania willdenowi TaxID=441366 RepID=UPI001054CFEF|nr:dynein regulatory complex protein 9-like isoform X2 [Gouania willdenowi]
MTFLQSETITNHVSKMLCELEESQSFSYLLQLADAEEQRRQHEEKEMEERKGLEQRELALLLEELQQKQDKLNELEKVCITLTQQQNSQQEKKKDEVTKTQDFTYERKCQHAVWKLQQQLKVIQEMKENEKRAHEEGKKFLHKQHQELVQKLEKDQQYTTEMLQENKKQLLDVSRKKTLALDKLAEMQRKFREMERMVAEDKKEQEKLLQQEKETKSATKLQAWWRGCMVRKGLRSLKKAADGKKGGKNKKGKKKK